MLPPGWGWEAGRGPGAGERPGTAAGAFAAERPSKPRMLLRRALLSARAPPRAGSALCCRSARILCFSSSSADDPDKPPPAAAPAPSFLSDERIRVGDDYNRWKQLVPALSAGVSIGTYVAVPSVLGMHICSYQGVVAPIATDFTLSQLMLIAPAMPALGGLAAFMLADQNFGHRRMAFVFSVAYPATVYGLSAAAISANNLYAFGTSYALLGGLAFYCGYPQLPPFLGSTWFHDRPGLLTSTYFTSFGASLYLSNQVLKPLLAHFQEAPVRLGGIDEVSISFGEHGKPPRYRCRLSCISSQTSSLTGERLAMVDGAPCEVVVATTKDLMASGFASTLEEGVFVLGTGTNGACEAMVGLGAVVFGLTQFAAWGYRLPGTPDGRFKVPEPGSPNHRAPDRLLDRFFPQKAKKVETETVAREDELTVAEATRSPNFSLLFVGSLGVCMTGLPFMQLSKFMVNDMFGVALGAQAAVIAASLPGMVGNANASGRAVWGPIGDRIGVDKTYMLFGATVPALMLCPFATSLGKTHAGREKVRRSRATTLKPKRMLGRSGQRPGHGGPSLPSVGSGHGWDLCRLACDAPPRRQRNLRQDARRENLPEAVVFRAARQHGGDQHRLAPQGRGLQRRGGGPRRWHRREHLQCRLRRAQGRARLPPRTPHDSLSSCANFPEGNGRAWGQASKTVTVPLLLKLSPPGTADPSPYLYNEVLYGIAGFGALALACNVAAFKLPIRRRKPGD